MQTILIAGGDAGRGDHAAPRRVLELLGEQPNVRMHDVAEWNPGLAEEIGPAQEVVFIRADDWLGDPWLEPAGGPSPAADIVALARELFRFNGKAYVCHVPGLDFSSGTGLTPYAEQRARQAAVLLKRFLGGGAG